MPNLAELLEEDEEGSAAPEASEGGRRSDGAALLRAERQSVGSGMASGSGSPPHKFQRKGARWQGGCCSIRRAARVALVRHASFCLSTLPTCSLILCHADEAEGEAEDGMPAPAPPPRPSSVAETDVEVLQARVRELQTQVRGLQVRWLGSFRSGTAHQGR